MAKHGADIVKDIEAVPQVSLEYYESNIHPPSIYSKHMEAITKALEVDKVLKKFDDEEALRWAAFPKAPEKSVQHEDETFKHMATIAAAIVQAARTMLSEGPEPTMIMECRPNEPTLSEGRNDGFRSDGH
ncbi:hypothetical protein IW262DRAFT_1492634 [Armillaria fumosa]|nr:hypothetical protein IW262DRAFT_1492634 [Armillaria fumosa]